MIQSLAQFIYHESICFLFGANRSGHHSWPPLFVCSIKMVLISEEESQVGYIMIYGTSWNDEGTVINKSRNKMTKANYRIMGQWCKGQFLCECVCVLMCICMWAWWLLSGFILSSPLPPSFLSFPLRHRNPSLPSPGKLVSGMQRAQRALIIRMMPAEPSQLEGTLL